MRTQGSARRSAATLSPRCVSSFSRACSFLRSASHCCRDTTRWSGRGWFAGERLTLAVTVVMVGSLMCVRGRRSRATFGTGCPNGGSYKFGGIAVDSLITAAARALAAGDPLGALNRVALRDDAPALALRGIAMAQLGDFAVAKTLVKRAARAFGAREAVARARCVVAEAEIALVSRELGWPTRALDAARATLEQHGDRVNAGHARHLEVRRLLLVGRLDEAERRLAEIDPAP